MKKSELKTMIRTIVREEVAMAIKEVVTELRAPVKSNKRLNSNFKKKVVNKKQYTSNKVLNEILNETDGGISQDEYPMMGGGVYDSSRVHEILQSTYGDLNINGEIDGDQMVASMGVNPDRVDDKLKGVLSRDYTDVMKAIEKKKGNI